MKRSIRKYTKVGMEGVNHFYEAEEDSENTEEEQEITTSQSLSESSSSVDSESDSDEMPLPTFLLNRHDNDYSPLEIYNTASEESSLPTKTAHQTKKGAIFNVGSFLVFAKAKDKGIMRVFKFLINNEFIQSFSFIPIPVSAQDTRMKVAVQIPCFP